jgi:hypothetical protein
MKTEEEIKQQIKDSKYSPTNDPLMARSIRKYNPNMSTYTNNDPGRVRTTDSRTKMFVFDFKSPGNLASDDKKRQSFLLNMNQSRKMNALNKTDIALPNIENQVKYLKQWL